MSVIFDVWLFNMEQAVCFVARGSYLLHSHWCVCLCLVRSPQKICLSGCFVCPLRGFALPGRHASRGIFPLGWSCSLRGSTLSEGTFSRGGPHLRGSPQGVVLFRGLAIPGNVLNVFTIRLIDSGHEMTMLAYGLRVWKYLVFGGCNRV